MQIGFFRIIVLLFVVSFSSCEKNKCECTCLDEIYNEWEVVEFMSIESVLYAKDDDFNPVIEFKKDETLGIRLDANGCFGDFEISKNNKIEIGMVGCTEMCCDSDFSMKFIEMLSQVTSFEMEKNKLKLHVPAWGWINLIPNEI